MEIERVTVGSHTTPLACYQMVALQNLCMTEVMDLIQPVRPDLTDALLQKVDEVQLLRIAVLSRMVSGMLGLQSKPRMGLLSCNHLTNLSSTGQASSTNLGILLGKKTSQSLHILMASLPLPQPTYMGPCTKK